jgi:hypothetical protein
MTPFHQHVHYRLASAVVLLLSLTGLTFAREPSTRETEQTAQQDDKDDSLLSRLPERVRRHLEKIKQAGDTGAPDGFAATFGDIKRGSGFAPGVAYGHSLPSGTVVVLKGVYSINNYKLVQMAAQSRPLLGNRVFLRGRARWQDAPSVRLYALGSEAPDVRTGYAETKTEVSGEAAWTPLSAFRVLAGAGLEQFDTGFAHNQGPAGLLLFASMPGAGADPRYVHSQTSAAFDLRDSPGYSRRGSLIAAAFHNYHQTSGGPFSFQRVDAAAEQYIPIVRNKWVVYVNVHASTTMTAAGHEVPFFLLPDLGGHDLRGFSDYRFRDRHSISWTAEYRWLALEFLDAAVFYDAGKTVANRASLNFEGLKSSVGGGIRLHGARATFLRLDVAHSREGLRFVIAFSPVGQ